MSIRGEGEQQCTTTTMHNQLKKCTMQKKAIIWQQTKWLRDVTIHNDHNEQWIKWITTTMHNNNNDNKQWTRPMKNNDNDNDSDNINNALQCLTKICHDNLIVIHFQQWLHWLQYNNYFDGNSPSKGLVIVTVFLWFVGETAAHAEVFSTLVQRTAT